MGSLNGTLVNSVPVGAAHKANATVRQRGQPTALANGDIVTLGSSSNVLVSGVDQLCSVVIISCWPSHMHNDYLITSYWI